MTPRRSLALLLFVAAAVAQEAPRGVLEGQVVDAQQVPLPNCAIAVEVDGRAVAAVRTDGCGFFVAPRLPAGAAIVRATAAEAIGAARVDLVAGANGFVWITAFPARTLRGRVTTVDGSPVVGAWVQATPRGDDVLPLADAMVQSGADGTFALPHVMIGPARVRAWVEGHPIFTADVVGDRDATLDCELPDERVREAVFELRGATPAQLASAELLLWATHKDNTPTRLPPPLRVMRPDADGRCVVRGWTDDDRLVGAFVVPGLAIAPAVDFVPRGPRTWTCRFDAQPEAVIRGVLRDEAGQPLGGEWLRCCALGDDDQERVAALACTGADGSFAVPSPAASGDRFVLTLAGGDHVLVDSEAEKRGRAASHVAQHDSATVHRLSARRAAAVRVRVVDAAGAPVRGAGVAVQVRAGGHPFVAKNQRAPSCRSGATGADGMATLRRVAPYANGRVEITVVAVGGIAEHVAVFDPGADFDVTLALRAPVPFAGVVRDAAGKPVVGQRVAVRRRSDFKQWCAVSDHDGRFAFSGLGAGAYCCYADTGRAQQFAWRDVAVEGVTDLELVVR